MTDINGNATTVAPDPNARAGKGPTAGSPGERFASLTNAQRTAVGLANNGEFLRPAAPLVNDPSVPVNGGATAAGPFQTTVPGNTFVAQTFQAKQGTAADNEAASSFTPDSGGTVVMAGLGNPNAGEGDGEKNSK